MSLRLLRGRVMIKPIKVAPSKIIEVVESDKRDNRNSLGRGVVVMMGAPAFAKDGVTEVPPDFAIGDEVFFVGQHVSRIHERALWTCKTCGMASDAESPYDVGDREPCVFCENGTAQVTWERVHMVAQEECQAVIE